MCGVQRVQTVGVPIGVPCTEQSRKECGVRGKTNNPPSSPHENDESMHSGRATMRKVSPSGFITVIFFGVLPELLIITLA